MPRHNVSRHDVPRHNVPRHGLWRAQIALGALICLTLSTLPASIPGAAASDRTADRPAGGGGGPSVYVWGDSVILGAETQIPPTIGATIPEARVEMSAEVGRSALESPGLLAGRSDDVVVISIGHNDGPVGFSQRIDAIMASLENVDHVVWLTQQEFQADRPGMNADLRDAARRHAGLEVLDWNALAASTPNANWDDGLHLRPEGAQAMADAIAEVVDEVLTVPLPALLAVGAAWSLRGVERVAESGVGGS